MRMLNLIFSDEFFRDAFLKNSNWRFTELASFIVSFYILLKFVEKKNETHEAFDSQKKSSFVSYSFFVLLQNNRM